MKREVLFRGKTIDNGEWVFGNYVHDPENGHLIIRFDSEVTDSENNLIEPVKKVFQVEGHSVGELIRTNGTLKIFEGDIIEFSLYEGMGLPARHGLKSEVTFNGFTGWENNVKVLGNVFDNPDVLKFYGHGF